MKDHNSTVPEYVVHLRPKRDASDPNGVRALRRMLKYALRVCDLQCTRVIPQPKSEDTP